MAKTIIEEISSAPIVEGVFYGGDAGAKEAVALHNSVWMVKYPKTTRDLKNPQISYTTSPLSEYIGSKIYELLGLPVHKTVLAMRNGKIVVLCKDFTRELRGCGQKGFISGIKQLLIPFHDLKNSFMAGSTDEYSGTGSETFMDEVLAAVKGQNTLKNTNGVLERFWAMFVIDAFIGNNDRNNGNWGLLMEAEYNEATKVAPAPVYDNGNAFFNKRSIKQMQTRLSNSGLVAEDACKTLTCAYKYTGLDNEGHRINPFVYMRDSDDADCRSALSWFLEAVDMAQIADFINGIPDNYKNHAVMPEVQKRFYIELMKVRLSYMKDLVMED